VARSLRRQLEAFVRNDNRCYYCKQPTILYSLDVLQNWPKGKPLDPMMATIEHLYSRNNPQRHLQDGSESSHVLAHRRCNQRQNLKELSSATIAQRLKARAEKNWTQR